MVSNDDTLVDNIQNIDTIDLDEYYIGCDSRISKSSTITNAMIKYWINVQNELTVQRYLSLIGSAAIGDVLIEYSTTDSMKYGVAQNGAIDSYKSILKTISDSQFNYIENNSTINGWIIDYLLNPNDVSDDYTIITGGGLCFDDDLVTYESDDNDFDVYATIIETSFDSRSINSVHIYSQLKSESAIKTSYLKIDLKVSGGWVEVDVLTVLGQTWTPKIGHYNTGWDNVTGLRLQLKTNTSGSRAYSYVHDVSVLESVL